MEEDIINILPKEISSQILGYTNIDDILTFCLTSKESAKICDNIYLINIVKNKYLPRGNYDKYTNNEILRLAKYNLMYVKDFYDYDMENTEDFLSHEFIDSDEYKKGIINTYILPLLKDDNYNIIDLDSNKLEWLMNVRFDDLMVLSMKLYPVDKHVYFISRKFQDGVNDILKRMFYTDRLDEDIIALVMAFMEGNVDNDILYRMSDTLYLLCLRMNRINILNYLLRFILPYIKRESWAHLRKFIDMKNAKVNIEDEIDYFCKYAGGNIASNNYYQLVSDYLSNGGTITKTIDETLNTEQGLYNILIYCTMNHDILLEKVNPYIMKNYLQEYEGKISASNFKYKLTPKEYIEFVAYVIGSGYNNDILFKYIENESEYQILFCLNLLREDRIETIIKKLGIEYVYHYFTINFFTTKVFNNFLKIVSKNTDLQKFSASEYVKNDTPYTYFNRLILALYRKDTNYLKQFVGM
ncbi:Hypothetical protein ORPV_715 [Orpheovirus IHUMI-LCC2]|uniref:F-box domain-containing protein n=1 Tax=Orpheovirus IHUMI-LCC2 TaxID=2023057 RepID=A0A2I2L585_9VIRU|nr:Hypothetical protein ORPV_715 [Orpheovirus IHUMI-LCC2]SNW62619.1 Hypothetical protein ORPV_715 [Orpheovirus IHUMI-LCC2]